MKGPWWMVVLTVGAVLCLPLQASAQVTLPCTRVDTNDMVASVGAWVQHPWEGVRGSTVSDADPMYAHADNKASWSDPMLGYGEAQGSTTAMCLTPQGGVASVPQVDTTASGSAMSTGAFFAWAEVNANAPTLFRVERNGDVAGGILRGSMYLVGGGSGQHVTGSSVGATCANSWVSAFFDGFGWSVTGVRQTLSGPEQIMDYFGGSLNVLYECEEYTVEGDIHAVGAGCSGDPCAGWGWGPSARRDLSATSWFEVEEF